MNEKRKNDEVVTKSRIRVYVKFRNWERVMEYDKKKWRGWGWLEMWLGLMNSGERSQWEGSRWKVMEIDLNGGWCLVGGAFRTALRPLWSLLLGGFVTPLHPFFCSCVSRVTPHPCALCIVFTQHNMFLFFPKKKKAH